MSESGPGILIGLPAEAWRRRERMWN